MPHPISESRRHFLLGASALALPALASAQTVDLMGGGQQQSQMPAYQPYQPVRVAPLYRQRVVELLEFTCPFCRSINLGAQAWGASLPKPYVFEQMPMVYDKDSALVAAVYYTAILADPARKSDIVSSMFHAVQDLHQSPTDPRTYVKAAAQAGVTQAQFTRALQDSKGRVAYVERVATFTQAVKPRLTPTFVVNDKALDVNNANGDYQKLFQLLDGFVSQGLQHHG